MIRNENYDNGVCTEADVIDPDTGTISREEFGVIVSVREMTAAERALYCPVPRPLNDAGALAALLVVEGQLSIEDAANAVGVTPDALVAEAQAWAVAANP